MQRWRADLIDDPDGPMFVADAIADPVAGLAAAAIAAELLVTSGLRRSRYR